MVERRLAAILIADAVGFTARMAENETAALRAIVASLEVLRTLIALNGTSGRPSSWTGNAYPRPGASNYGAVTTAGRARFGVVEHHPAG